MGYTLPEGLAVVYDGEVRFVRVSNAAETFTPAAWTPRKTLTAATEYTLKTICRKFHLSRRYADADDGSRPAVDDGGLKKEGASDQVTLPE
ncbi:hypothetical protein HDU87_002048 [Geranomyces variabilis]|uniref:Uncharacterized protein n=1 Tax=Geranomyces variabilis TaxID=109894 RepID=A0AAD5TLZ8_9FUNG|nr:hypothetical protein HDU87_002048 [Geranomyces variabilis]